MDTTEFKYINLSTDMMDANQVSQYVENGFVHVSGDSNVGNLHLSGNLTISSENDTIFNNFSIINGSYRQTTEHDMLSVMNFSGCNSFIQAVVHKPSYGIASTGSRGYYILQILSSDCALRLSGDISTLQSLKQSGSLGTEEFRCSLALFDAEGTFFGNISNVNVQTSVVYFTKLPKNVLQWYSNKTEQDFIDEIQKGDNGLYFPNHTEIGNTVLKNFTCQHAEGGSVKAIGKYSHAEGRKTIADVRYSHAEGSHTIAGGMASHAEGFFTEALGDTSHSQGLYTYANGDYSNSNGVGSVAKDNYSWIWNGNSKVTDEPLVKYESKGEGTFCINPRNGLDGFYIGNESIANILKEKDNAISRLEYLLHSEKIQQMDQRYGGSVVELDNGDVVYIPKSTQTTVSYQSLSSHINKNRKIKKLRKCDDSATSVPSEAFKSNICQVEYADFGNVTSLGWGCFGAPPGPQSNPQSNLYEIYGPKVKTISGQSFNYCKKLRYVYFPLVQTLEQQSFYNCESLSSASFQNVNTIGQNVFASCRKMRWISIPNVTSIGTRAFSNCYDLMYLDFSSRTLSSIPSIPDDLQLFDGIGHVVSCYVPVGMKTNWENDETWKSYIQNNKVTIMEN